MRRLFLYLKKKVYLFDNEIYNEIPNFVKEFFLPNHFSVVPLPTNKNSLHDANRSK